MIIVVLTSRVFIQSSHPLRLRVFPVPRKSMVPTWPQSFSVYRAVSTNYNLKSHKYVCIATYQPDTKYNHNPNPNHTTKQHTIANIQLNTATSPAYPDTFIQDIVALSVLLSVVIVTLPCREALEKMRDVYAQNPKLGDAATLSKQLDESLHSVDHLQSEISKYEVLTKKRYYQYEVHSSTISHLGIIIKMPCVLLLAVNLIFLRSNCPPTELVLSAHYHHHCKHF